MALTPILGIQQVATNQSNKEATINDAVLALEAAGNAVMVLDYSGLAGDSYTVAEADFLSHYLFRTATPRSAATALGIVLPRTINGHAIQRVFVIRNATALAVTAKIDGALAGTTGATGVILPAGSSRLMQIDGDDLIIAGQAATITRLIDVADAPHSYNGQSGKFLRVKASEDGVEFGFQKLADLDDVSTDNAPDGAAIRYNAGTQQWSAQALRLVTTFLGLDDVPDSYANAGGFLIRINSAANAVEFVNPAAYGGPVTGGGNTNQVLTKNSATDGDYGWKDVPHELPAGGTTGKILKKTSGNDYDVSWGDAPIALPTGGTEGQVLTKNSDIDGDASWQDPTGGSGGGSDPVSLTPHRYWRLNVSANNGSTNWAIGEVEFIATSSGVVDQASNGTATAQTTNPGYPASNAFDNNNDTLYGANQATGWLAYDFGSPVKVGQITLRSRNDGATADAPRDLAVEWSDDGVSWTIEWAVSGQTGWTKGEKRVFVNPNGNANSWVVTATGTGSSQTIRLPGSGYDPTTILVFVNGLKTKTTDYSITGYLLTITTNASGDDIEILPK